MSITIGSRPSRDGKKRWHHFEWGKGADQRRAAGIFTYTKPENQVQRNHNKEALEILEVKRSQFIIERQSIGTGHIPAHKYKDNFLDYYQEYVDQNPQKNNRHLVNSLVQFKKFLGRDRLSPIDVTENLCIRFRKFLLDRFNGDTPANYFACFKTVMKNATKEGYFRLSPAGDVQAKGNASVELKENLEADEYVKLLQTPFFHEEVREAFIFSCYTGFRFCDVSTLTWQQMDGNRVVTRIIQRKTGKPLMITLHPIAKAILEKRKTRKTTINPKERVFELPDHKSCNEAVKQWVKRAAINKKITWSCARLSFSILLQDENVNDATVALLLGHTTTKYVHERYKRYRPKNASEDLNKLPGSWWLQVV